jgi:hypothetical protein
VLAEWNEAFGMFEMAHLIISSLPRLGPLAATGRTWLAIFEQEKAVDPLLYTKEFAGPPPGV